MKIHFCMILQMMCLQASAMSDKQVGSSIYNFLQEWLVNGNIECVDSYLSYSPHLCIPSEDTGEPIPKNREEVKKLLKEVMKIVLDRIGRHSRLELAITRLSSGISNNLEINNRIDYPCFTVLSLSQEEEKNLFFPTQFFRGCIRGDCYLVLFEFNVPKEMKEGMYYIFHRESGKLRIIYFDRIRQ